MRKKKSSDIGVSPTTRTAYVGKEIYDELYKDAIEISYEVGQQITASQFLKYIASNFRELARKKLVEHIKRESAVKV